MLSERQDGEFAKTADFRRYLADLTATHTTCAWRMPHYVMDDVYIVAVRRGHGAARCVAAVGCTAATLRAELSTCRPEPHDEL